MNAIGAFKATSARAKPLIDLRASLTSPQNAAMPDSRDLLRSAITPFVAGMDAYFTDRFAESFVRFLKKREATPDLTTLLLEADLDAKAALEMLTMKHAYRRIRKHVEAYWSQYTTQKQSVIDKLFRTASSRSLR